MVVNFGSNKIDIAPSDVYRDQNKHSRYYPDRFIVVTEVRYPYVFAVCVNTLRKLRLEIGAFSPGRKQKGYTKVESVPQWLEENLAKIG